MSIILEFFSFNSYILDFGLEGGVLGLGLGSCGLGLEVCVLGLALALGVMSLLTSLLNTLLNLLLVLLAHSSLLVICDQQHTSYTGCTLSVPWLSCFVLCCVCEFPGMSLVPWLTCLLLYQGAVSSLFDLSCVVPSGRDS